MDLNKLANDSFENVKRRIGKDTFEFSEWADKADEELTEWKYSRREKKSEHCPELTEDEEEAADVILVMLSYAASMGYDVEKILTTKHKFNLERE